MSFRKLFKSYLDEVCVECKKQPGSRGCTRVKTNYELKGEQLEVDHTNDTHELIRIEDAVDESCPALEILPVSVPMSMPSPVAEVRPDTQNINSTLYQSDRL